MPPRLAALSSFCVPRFGFVVKLKTPWPPGLSPVMNDDHAVGVNAGIVESERPERPLTRETRDRRELALAYEALDERVIRPVEREREDASHLLSTSR